MQLAIAGRLAGLCGWHSLGEGRVEIESVQRNESAGQIDCACQHPSGSNAGRFVLRRGLVTVVSSTLPLRRVLLALCLFSPECPEP